MIREGGVVCVPRKFGLTIKRLSSKLTMGESLKKEFDDYTSIRRRVFVICFSNLEI